MGGVFAGLAATTLGGNLADSKEGGLVHRALKETGEQSTVAGQGGSNSPLISSGKAKARFVEGNPALTLDDSATAWMPRRVTELAGMPGLNNDIGAIQVEADIAAIKHPVFPPYSGGNEITGVTLLNDRQLANFCRDDIGRHLWNLRRLVRQSHPTAWLETLGGCVLDLEHLRPRARLLIERRPADQCRLTLRA